jgi:hypothetical protein
MSGSRWLGIEGFGRLGSRINRIFLLHGRPPEVLTQRIDGIGEFVEE